MQMVSQFNKNTILAQMHILSYPQGDPVFYYLGVRVEGQQPLEIHLWQNKKGDNNFHAQFEGRTLADLTKAKNDGKTIFYDGFTVCLSLSLSLSHAHTLILYNTLFTGQYADVLSPTHAILVFSIATKGHQIRKAP